ncbi:hypothetical protein H0H93_000658 [Arthromyces matolae]|nr:hypothetical protein H0H93_000658 [Arthromyces matolae]
MGSNGERDRLFPATSIGRTGGSQIQRVPSNELLAAHPLLSPGHSFDSASGPASPRYVPYTPRQRVSPTAATTGTTIHPPSPQHQGEATSKLQLVNLKAAAQNIGLDAGSVGWAILEKLVQENDHQDSEWTEILTSVTSGKLTAQTFHLHLVSNLLYTQRYRNQSIGGEESYCLVNLMAVAEFLENVDLAALGLGESDKVLSAADLTPIPLNRSPISNATPLAAADGLPGRLRDGVEQANKVISGVMDTSFGMLRSLLPVVPQAGPASTAPATSGLPTANAEVPIVSPSAKPGFGLLRRESGFSIRSITAALDMGRGTPKGGEETGQQLVTVARPGSIRSLRGDESGVEESEGESDDEEEDEDEDEAEATGDGAADGRSIRSFESMLSAKVKGKGKNKKDKSRSGTRKSLTDRLASMSTLAGRKGQNAAPTLQIAGTPGSSRPPSPEPTTARAHLRLAPPIARFLECSVGDLKLSEVSELLNDYRRLVEGIRGVKGFDE